MLPMLGGEVVESEQGIAILDQAGARFLIFRPILGEETVEGLVGAWSSGPP